MVGCERATRNNYHRVAKTPDNQEIVDASVESGEYEIIDGSEYEEDYIEKRVKKQDDGGYGGINEQLSLLYDKIAELGSPTDANLLEGLRFWYNHINTVKTNNPKPPE